MPIVRYLNKVLKQPTQCYILFMDAKHVLEAEKHAGIFRRVVIFLELGGNSWQNLLISVMFYFRKKRSEANMMEF